MNWDSEGLRDLLRCGKNDEDGGRRETDSASKNSEIQREREREQLCPTCMDTQVTPDNYNTYGVLSLSLSAPIHLLIYCINPHMSRYRFVLWTFGPHKIIKTYSLFTSLTNTLTYTHTTLQLLYMYVKFNWYFSAL